MNTKLEDPLAKLMTGDEIAEAGVMPSHQMIPRGHSGDTAVSVMGEIVTAQRVAVPRVMADIRRNIKELAAMSGSRWVYRIPFKNRKTGQTDYVEGPTIKCTNSVVRCYGNSLVTSRVIDNGDHWMIYARFVDLQTGSTYDRPFQQRKSQDTGMKDAGRAMDIVFQIGVSKATRNVIANCLEDLVSFAVEEAKKGILERVGKNPDGARNWILEQLKEQGVDVKRVSAVYGRTPEHWTVPDMAKMFAEINSIQDGMVDADDLYPREQTDRPKQSDAPKEPTRKKDSPDSGPSQGAQEQAAKPRTPDPEPKPEKERAPGSLIPAGAIVHFFDERKKPLGSLPYRQGIDVGKQITIDQTPLHITELHGTENPLVWVAEVVKIAESDASPAGDASAGKVGELMDQADAATSPATPKPRGRPKGSKAIDFGELA